MRRTFAIVALWLAAGAGAVVLSSAAVSMVGNRVTVGRPATLSADQVRDQLLGDSGSTTLPMGGAKQTPSSDDATTSTRPTEDGTTRSTTNPEITPTTQGQSAGDDIAPTSSTTTPATQPATVRTYTLVGGTATLRFSPSGVTVQDATPQPGYSVEIEVEHGTGVRVEFRSSDHRSRVDGWWDNGPRDEVSEDDGSDS